MAWTDFVALASSDAQASDERGQYARDMLAALGHYMETRFGTDDVSALGDLVADGGVIDAVSANLAAIAAAETAVVQAASAVVASRTADLG